MAKKISKKEKIWAVKLIMIALALALMMADVKETVLKIIPISPFALGLILLLLTLFFFENKK